LPTHACEVRRRHREPPTCPGPNALQSSVTRCRGRTGAPRHSLSSPGILKHGIDVVLVRSRWRIKRDHDQRRGHDARIIQERVQKLLQPGRGRQHTTRARGRPLAEWGESPEGIVKLLGMIWSPGNRRYFPDALSTDPTLSGDSGLPLRLGLRDGHTSDRTETPIAREACLALGLQGVRGMVAESTA